MSGGVEIGVEADRKRASRQWHKYAGERGFATSTGWKSANGGDIFRDHARKRGLTVEEFSSLCRENLDVDRALDVALKSLMMDQSGPRLWKVGCLDGGQRAFQSIYHVCIFQQRWRSVKKANAKRWRILRG